MKRANFGCGGQIVDGWDNIDRGALPGVMVRDLLDPLPYMDGGLDYAVCHHVLDLMSRSELVNFLRECARVIKEHGVLRISIADTRGAIETYEREDWAWFSLIKDLHQDGESLLTEYLFLHGARKTFLTTTIVANMLTDAGFTPYVVAYQHTICDDEEICALDSRPSESVYLEGMRT